MRKLIFKAAITGRDLVAGTGCVRTAESFRICMYDDGETVITTRGKWSKPADGKDKFYSLNAVKARLAKLAKLSDKRKKASTAKRLPPQKRS
jgi:hypothetical protein